MASDIGPRPLLPQSTQVQSFSFAPPNAAPRENQKNYVFVDEHNRHKRLKVMRACEGCRRRKIKCDAATTNTWPCSACIRLKLQCNPPTVNYDQEFGHDGIGLSVENSLGNETLNGSGDEQSRIRPPNQHQPSADESAHGHLAPLPYKTEFNAYQTTPYSEQQSHQGNLQYTNVPLPPVAATINPTRALCQPESIFPSQHSSSIASHEMRESWAPEQYSAAHLSNALGELKIDESGIAPYISQQKRSLAEAPAFEEFEISLPMLAPGPDLTVRIPPELLPGEDQALLYFDIFFANIHPYVPVLNRSYFYQQWHTNRESISPLILEAIFACAGRMSGDPSEGSKWLALAGKHADCFMDVPRLSTIQAMLLILKARESAPKRGYYYRSWMTVVTLVAMAKDLALDEHFELHQTGQPCGSDPNDCITKTRVWQTLFVCETMIGGPQGRSDMSVDADTIDTNTPRAMPGLDVSDSSISRQFTYLTRCVKNVRRLIQTYAQVKKKEAWANDPQFVRLNPSFIAWFSDLPPDLQVVYPADGSPPWIPSHFVGNLHSYYHLSIIMLHRPQLVASDSFALDGAWKQHMLLCYCSAKSLCKLQESVLQSFGLPGLLCMQRGINFTIYAVLTCTMLHLVALTSPDPEFNRDAKDYFTRHMRILEQCTSSWPMPDMQTQIDALREAFSADVRKPFVLKPTFPYGSPPPARTSPMSSIHYHSQGSSRNPSIDQPSQINYHTQPLTPPISAGAADTTAESPAVQSLVLMARGQTQEHPIPNNVPMTGPTDWNPSQIFNQWNTAFGTPPQSQPTPQVSPPLKLPHSGPHHDLQHVHEAIQPSLHQNVNYTNRSQQSTAVDYTNAPPAFVTPTQWRESVAGVFGDGPKRRWDLDGETFETHAPKRSR
ncbi:MAG: hypothetical protein M1812_003150 [Candelaria pacifica]|nr:MAG: hypothetical protein M1812_003150 [Candelaria pacifica]